MFATAFYAVIDLDQKVMRSACAGHPGGIIIGPGGIRQLAAEKSGRGPGLGLIPHADFPSQEISLNEFNRLILFTDGIIEAENEAGEAFLESGLLEVIEERRNEHLEEMLDGIISSVLTFSEDHHFDDDVCLLGMELEEIRP